MHITVMCIRSLRTKLLKKTTLLFNSVVWCNYNVNLKTCCLYNRDDAQQKMIILKEKADKDLQQHNAEMKELLRIIDHDRNLRGFMGIKGQERQEDPQLVIWRQRKGEQGWKNSQNVYSTCIT